MNIQIQAVHFDADQKLIDFIEKKVKKLENYFDKIVEAEVYLMFEEESSQIKKKIAEIKLHIPGTSLFTKENAMTFEEAIDNAVESIRRQLERYKAKVRAK